MKALLHKHFIGRFEVKNPPTKSSGIYLELWLRRLIEAQNMEIFDGPHLKYLDEAGNRGWTCAVLIKTSSVTMHIWDEMDPSLIQLDFYSCSDVDTQKILSAIDEWGITSADWWVLDREFVITRLPEYSRPSLEDFP